MVVPEKKARRGNEELTPKQRSSNQLTTKIVVDSPDVENDGQTLCSTYSYKRNHISNISGGGIKIEPQTHQYHFKTQLKPGKTGLLLVGLGGNNGSTLVGSLVANKEKLTWRTKDGVQSSNYFGSITQATTVHLGWDGSEQVHVPFKNLLPMVEPNDLIVDGWDINNANLYEAMKRARVFEAELQDKLRPYLESITPKPSIYYPDFIASNQEDRANNVLKGKTKLEHLNSIRADIRQFKSKHNLDCVVVLWTASTERFAKVRPGLNQTAKEIVHSIEQCHPEVAPSHIFAVAAIMEGAHYINGSPQNSLVPGIVELAHEHKSFIGGDDFKSGQTKLKSALVDFLISSGLKPESIVSYNHLGNNDGKNLSEEQQFNSKKVTKSSVVDDMVQSNKILYPDGRNPDHEIVIKYVPFVGDSKRAMDEYISSIFMGGKQEMIIHNKCEDSLLATPLILDLTILTELFSRIRYSTAAMHGQFESFDPVLSLLSCLLKAPAVPKGTPVCNALMKQLNSLTKVIKAVAGIESDSDMQLEFFTHMSSGKAMKKPVIKHTNGTHTNGVECESNGHMTNGQLGNGVHVHCTGYDD